MKHLVAKAVAPVLFSMLVALGSPSNVQAQPSCSNASLVGSFGFTSTGTVSDPSASLFTQVGRQIFDGKGNTEAAATTSVNGSTFPVTVKGTYTVNADCTGSLTLHVSPVGITVHADFVIVSDGAEFLGMVTDPGSAVTVVAKRQFRY